MSLAFFYIFLKECNTLRNATRTLKDDAITIILLLYHPPRGFITLPFSYYFSLVSHIWEYMRNSAETVCRMTNSKIISKHRKIKIP